jgi:hypothetical protein
LGIDVAQQRSTATLPPLREFTIVDLRPALARPTTLMLPLCKQSPCLSNCLTTTLETSSQLWTMLEVVKREASHQGAYRAHLIRQRSVVQLHLGPRECALTRALLLSITDQPDFTSNVSGRPVRTH